MEIEKTASDLSLEVEAIVRSSFKPQFGQLTGRFETDPTWQRLREIGSELWLDTGSIEDAQQLWTQEFAALTTNNTLLNREVQTGRYDSLIGEAAQMLSAYPHLTEHQRMLEMAFILNAWHGLRLVETFDAYVSVEEHTALAHDVNQTVDYARRYHAICPERFIVKIPLTPAGLLATRRVSAEGIPVNHTLGFSARQNYMIARVGRPAFVNVFLGRLNSFVVDNDLGDGGYVGEKATLASQAAVRELRRRNMAPTRQIGASFRAGAQVRDLAGIDVMTMPPKVASEFLSTGMSPDQIADKTAAQYSPGLNEDVDRRAIRLDTLWDIDNELVACLDALEKENIDSFTPDELIHFFAEHGCADVLVPWSQAQVETSTAEGKIPKLENWRDLLGDRSIGLDSLMNLAGLRSFATDQKAMDDRVRQVLER
jgi:transaldolase